jgi:hypothetical protein
MMAGILALGLTGCSIANSGMETDSTSPASAANSAVAQEFLASPDLSAPLQTALRRTQVKAKRLVVPEDAVAVSLYVPDDECLNYLTEEVFVSRQDDLTETVELILAEQEIPFFELTGYRLNREPDTKTVTIDLRVSRTSPRLLQSLSFCEQMMLLGSIKETLLNHPEWDIEQVEFTNRGYRLVL